MSKLRAAVVGTGFIATKKHLPSFAVQRELADVVAIVDVNEEAARRVAAEFSIPNVYSDLSKMLEGEAPDLVDICTPPRTHASIAIEALKSGANVMIEKPMATSVEECDEILATAKQAGRQVCVGHSDLFYPPFIKARKLVADGAIGEVKGMQIFLSTPVDYMTSKEDHWAHKLPGGVIGESGPHTVYMTLAFIDPIKEVRALGTKLLGYPWSRFEDYRIELIGESAVSSITSVYTSDEWAGHVDIWGTQGLLKLDLETMSLVRQNRKNLDRSTVTMSGIKESLTIASDIARTGATVATKRYRNTHDHLIGGFIESISRGGEPPVSGEQGREAVRVMSLIARRLDDS